MKIKFLILFISIVIYQKLYAQFIWKQPLVHIGESDYTNRYSDGECYLNIDTYLYGEDTRNGILRIMFLNRIGFYDLVKEKWVKEYETIGGNNYNKLYNQVLEFSRTEEFKYIKATKKIKAKAKQLGKEDYITNRDSILTGFVTSTVVVRSAETGKLLYKIEVPLDELRFEEVKKFKYGDEKVKILRIKCIDDAFYSPDGRFLITYGDELPLNIYDAKNGKLMKFFSINKSEEETCNLCYYRNVLKNTAHYSKQFFTYDNKYIIYHLTSNDPNYPEPNVLYCINGLLFNADSLKFIKPNITWGGNEQDYFANNYVFKSKNNFDSFNGLQNILDSNKYYKFECKIDSFKNDILDLLPTYDTNCILVKSNKYQCLWYYKTNKQVFTIIFTKQNNDSLRNYLQNIESFLVNNELCQQSYLDEDSLRSVNLSKELYKNNYYYTDSTRVANWLKNSEDFNTNDFYSNYTVPYIITQNFAQDYYKIWDVSKGVLVDSFKNDTYIQEWQNIVAKGNNKYTYAPMAVSLSPKGNIIWVHLSRWVRFLYKAYFSNYSSTDIAIKAYHISNTKKAFDLTNMLAYSEDETKLLNRVDSNTVAILSLLTGKVEKTITLKGYNLKAAFYSPQKKSFIGVATKNNNRKLYLYVFTTGKLLDLNKPDKNVQVLKTLED
jgi:hypothetical protein